MEQASNQATEVSEGRWRWPWVLAAIVVLGGGVELWAQSQDPQVPQWSGPGAAEGGLQTGHPTRLWGMEEGLRGNGKEIQTQINAHGLRGEEPELPRPAGRHRILTLGDSAFFGFMVSDEDVFTSHLQRILRERGVDVDVINGGVSGYSIAQHRLLMDEQGWALDPTLIVYCNVWSDNTWDTFKDEDLLEARRFAHLNPLVHSSAMRLLAEALSRPKSADAGRIIMWRGERGWPEGKIRRVPLSRFIALHDGLIRDAASRGIGGAFLIPTNSFMLSGDIDTSTPPSWDPYFQAFRLLGSHHSQPVVDVGEVFGAGQAEGLEVEDLLLDLMHPSPEGHRRMAVALADALLAAGWPESPLLGQSEPLDPLSIEDHPAPVWTDDDGAGSSQRYLFDISEAEQQAIKDRAAAMIAAGPPSPEAPAGPEAPTGPSRPAPPTEPSRPDPPGDPPAEAEHLVHSWGDGNEVHTELPVAPSAGIGGWTVQITVEGGQAPYRVVVRDGAGRAVASGRMLRPASIRLRIPGTIDEASAELTDGSGQMTTAPLTLDSPRATLKLED